MIWYGMRYVMEWCDTLQCNTAYYNIVYIYYIQHCVQYVSDMSWLSIMLFQRSKAGVNRWIVDRPWNFHCTVLCVCVPRCQISFTLFETRSVRNNPEKERVLGTKHAGVFFISSLLCVSRVWRGIWRQAIHSFLKVILGSGNSILVPNVACLRAEGPKRPCVKRLCQSI